MTDYRNVLERDLARVGPAPFDFDDVARRRDRKRRNQRIGAGVVGIAVFVAAVWIVTSVGSLDRSETSVGPAGDVTGPTETRPAETGPAETGPAETGPAETGPAETGPAEIIGPVPETDYLLDLDTGETTPLPESIVGREDMTGDYAVSPDGSRLAYTGPIGKGRGKAIFVANLDGTGVEQVTSVDPALGPGAGGSEPAWSPDGSRIAYVESRPNGLLRWWGTTNVVVLDLATGETTQVTDEPDGGWTTAPTFTPDGESIVYSAGAHTKEGDQILAVPVAGGPSVPLLGGDGAYAQHPALSPDGSLLSYVCGDVEEVSTGICLANADGSGARVFVPVAYVDGPEWSPDGTRIAYWTWPSYVYLYVVDVATGEVTTLGEGAFPTWLDDHTLIVETDHCNLPHDNCGF